MSSDKWYKVDNVAKVFLATHSARDTRTLRVSCTLTEDIDADILREALERTIVSRSLFQVRIRRGFFWNYIEATDVRPVVTEEHDRPCPVLYGKNYKGILHYNVTYYHRRINLEVFHALTDGAGALEFLNILVLNYLNIKYPDRFLGIDLGNNGSEAEREEDSFERFRSNDGKGTGISVAKVKRAYHIRGMKLPYDQLQFFEVSMSGKKVREMAKSSGVGISGLLGAVLMMAIYNDMPFVKRKLPVTISMPVNLRNYFPSETSRNFFNSINISHVFTGGESVPELAKEFEENMKKCLDPDSVRQNMDNYQKLERLFFIRMVPLALKQPIVKYFSKKENKSVSAVISNLGIMKLPKQMDGYVEGYSALCSHNGLFITVLSYGDTMTFGITSGYRNTGVIKNFVRAFSKNGIEVTVNGSEVVW